jgi:hypothetical protein
MPGMQEKLTALVGPVAANLGPEERPALIALAERIAAGRYRGWAERVADADVSARLTACAEREEDIAARVEALVDGAARIQTELLERHSDLSERYAELFAGRSLREQFALQAEAERVGAQTWRALAAGSDAPARDVFEECARLEEASAEVLETLAGAGPVSELGD